MTKQMKYFDFFLIFDILYSKYSINMQILVILITEQPSNCHLSIGFVKVVFPYDAEFFDKEKFHFAHLWLTYKPSLRQKILHFCLEKRKDCWTRYFFQSFIYNHYSQLIYMLRHAQQKLSATQNFLQKQSLTITETSYYFNSPHQLKITEKSSQKTLPQSLPFQSRSFDLDQPSFPNFLQEQIEVLQERYQGIHKLLIKHSGYQSNLHERRHGYKVMQIDQNSLGKDFSNKLHIIEDIKSLVANIGNKTELELDQLLQIKFQQYYLERHYGGLTCEIDNLSIQQRMDSSLEHQNSEKLCSKIGSYQSLVPESKITYSQEFCQTQEIGYEIYVEIPKIIEIQVPMIIFKLNSGLRRQNQNDQAYSHLSNIEDIINKFSKPYEELYSNKDHQNLQQILSGPHTFTPASILIQSNIQNTHTQIELAYSDFPEEDKFKLPLDSYAQIQSFISNDSLSASSHSRPPTDRWNTLNNETIFITEKVVSKSLLQKFEQTERALLEQNGQLKESINSLKVQIKQNQRRYRQLETQNTRLSNRLEQEIQQSQYFSSKFDELNAQFLQQKIQCLTHLNDSKERKIEMLMQQLSHKGKQIQELSKNVQQLGLRLKNQQQIINGRQEQIMALNKALAQKEIELTELAYFQQDVMQKTCQTEAKLKREIQILERQNSELKQTERQYKKRLGSQGISLQYEQASQIQGIIQTQQHHFNLELKEYNQKYEKILAAYQLQLNQSHTQLLDLQTKCEQKNALLNAQQQDAMIRKKQILQDCKLFEAIVQEYSKQLQIKDQQIIALKREYEQNQKKSKYFIELYARIQQDIVSLQNQLKTQNEQKTKLEKNSTQMEQFSKKQLQQQKTQKQLDVQFQLIQQLAQELQAKFNQNQELKTQISAQQEQFRSICAQKDQLATHLRQQNQKLKKVNSKLKRYTLSLEQEIKVFCGVDKTDSLKNWAALITQERNYYLQLSLQGTSAKTKKLIQFVD